MLRKVKEWSKRYALAEFVALIVSLVFAKFTLYLFGNTIISAFIASWGNTIGYQVVIIYNEIRSTKPGIKGILKISRNIIVEFGPAEILDNFLIRPFYLALMPGLIKNYSLAIFIGTLFATLTYYLPTILSYELRKKIFKE